MPTNNDDTNEDMTAALTRRDLKQILDQRLAKYPTKEDLRNELRSFATKDDLEQMHEQIVQENLANLRIVSEENRAWFRAIDDQYKDLPERVHKLEEAVFPPPPRARRRKSG